MTLFRGLRDYRTAEPSLSADLRRQNQALELGFEETERQMEARKSVVRVLEDTYQAAHGDMVLAGFNQAATVFLPPSAADSACRSVLVVRVSASFGVTVVAQPEQLVNGSSSVSIGAVGYREFIDDGNGGWWGPA